VEARDDIGGHLAKAHAPLAWRGASVLVIDDDCERREAIVAALHDDSRFRVHGLRYAERALDHVDAQGHEIYLVALGHDAAAGCRLINEIWRRDSDAVISAVDDRACTVRAAGARKAGAGYHFVLPLERTAAHLLAADALRARDRLHAVEFRIGNVRIRLDQERLYTGRASLKLGTSTEVKVIEALCRADSRPVSIDLLLDAGGYLRDTEEREERSHRALNALLRRFAKKLGDEYRSRLVRDRHTCRLICDVDPPDCACCAES
jgi:DNA-binding response OmpR family regulator